jgi:predicted DNA-binding transcriptional regulator YafY
MNVPHCRKSNHAMLGGLLCGFPITGAKLMDRINRLIATVLLFQRKKRLRAEDIAEYFGTSSRTVYRDIDALCQAGVPIAGEAGYGYTLQGEHLAPVMFTEEEAGAILMGAEFVRHLTDASLQQHLQAALVKVQSVIPSDKRDHFERMQSSVSVFTRPAAFQEHLGSDMLSTLQQAIAGRSVVQIAYENRHADASAREIEPLHLVFYGNHWHVIAYCRLRKEIRDFRLDRVLRLTILPEQFSAHELFSLSQYLAEQYDLREPHEVRVEVASEALRIIAAQKYYYGFVQEEPRADGAVLTFIVPSLQWIMRWLLSFGAHITILAPAELRVMFAQEVRAIALRQMNGLSNIADRSGEFS